MNLNENIQRIKEMMISEEMVQSDAWKSVKSTLDILKGKKKVLLLSFAKLMVISVHAALFALGGMHDFDQISDGETFAMFYCSSS